MRIKADEYYNNNFFEMARIGNSLYFKNNMSKKQHRELMVQLKENYPEIKEKIDSLVMDIREKVIHCNPLSLLSYCSDVFIMSNINVTSEFNNTLEEVNASRMTEYIQSVLVSSPNCFDETDSSDQSLKMVDIQNDLMALYSLLPEFYYSYGAYIEDKYPGFDESTRKIILEAQMLYLVRGQRYQIFEIEYYKNLLDVHNDIFQHLFNMTSEDIIAGIKELQYSLSQGKLDALSSLMKVFDKSFEIKQAYDKQFIEEHQGADFCEKLFGTALRDVIAVTGWNEDFVSSLSFEINGYSEFYDKEEFAGWPILDLPIQKRPFIKIKDKYYCFDYYSLMDNFYRVIQKTVMRLEPKYLWKDYQQEASERFVENVFKQLLPNCESFRDNYYPINGSMKKFAENDLLILYYNTIIIVEVKAGSFVYTPPFIDFEAHIKSYKTLIEKADHQCNRTMEYLRADNESKIYDSKGNLKKEIDMSAISNIYMFSVTMDNINAFANRAEKLSFLKLKCNAISISIDDLMVYREYFQSPLMFLHFLKQRQLATQEKNLALNDELDHLGMYIQRNCYTFQLDKTAKNTIIQFHGYREAIDQYFCSLNAPALKADKPQQHIPDLFIQMIYYLESSDLKNKVEISDYLLDFASDAKQDLCDKVEYSLKRQLEINHMCAISAAGGGRSLRYTCFVNQPGIISFSEEEKCNYALSTLLWNDETDRVLLNLYFDSNKNFTHLTYKKFTLSDIAESEIDKLKLQGKQIADMRMNAYKQSHKNKIGRNELCPCGSGKKYKKCCGR